MTLHDMEPLARPGAGLVTVDGRAYPLERVQVAGRAEGGIALTALRQSFANPHDEALEVVYTLPLPADGAVLGYTVRMGERVIRAQVEPREQAERKYREALYDGRSAGLLEQDRADTFQQRLGNLPPRTPVEVEIEVLHPLAFVPAEGAAGPRWEHRFPTVAGVRYLREPGRVRDAERMDPPRGAEGGIPVRAELALLAVPDGGEARFESPSHAIEHAACDDGIRVGFARPERLDRDVVVRWDAGEREVGVRVVEGGGLAGDPGRYALVTVTPPAALGAAFPRDLTLLIDASGSMSGAPLEYAKRIAEELLRSLGAGDRFEMLVFANDVVRLSGAATPADERAVDRVLRALRELRAGGGTEMAGALEQALKPLRADAQRQVVLVTDGYIGFEQQVVRAALRGLPRRSRVHVVGIGSAPNRALVNGLAGAGRGLELYAGSEAGAIEAGRRLCRGTARPVLSGLKVGGDAVVAAAPARPRGVFAGQPVLMAVELGPAGGSLVVEGDLAGAARPFRTEVAVPPAGATTVAAAHATTTLPLGALFGRAAIAEVEIEALAEASGATYDLRIEALGMRHRVASPRTSLVAIAEEPTVDPLQPGRRERLAVEVPYGVSAEGAGLMGLMGTVMAKTFVMAPNTLMRPGASGRRAGMRDLETGVGPPEVPGRLPEILRHPPGPSTEIAARVLRVEDDLLVLEFEAPRRGLEVPDALEVGMPTLRDAGKDMPPDLHGWRGRKPRTVAVERAPGTRGRIAGGRTVTLALRLPKGLSWLGLKHVVLRWPDLTVHLDVTLPPPPGEPA